MSRPDVRRSAATALEVVVATVIVLTALLGIVRPLLGPAALGIGRGPVFGRSPSVEATVDTAAVRVTTTPPMPTAFDGGEVASGDALVATIPTRTSISVYDPDLRQSVGLIGSEVLTGLLTVIVLVLLLLIVRTLRRGDPFLPVNARRLYLIAALVGLGGTAVGLLRSWGEAAVLGHPDVAPYVLQEAELNLLPLAAGLGIAVAAEVFRRGAELRADVEGLV